MSNNKSFKTFEAFINEVNEEAEGSMYLQQLQDIASNATKLREMIKPDDDLEAWVQNKIAIAHQNLDGILSHYKSESGEGVSAAAGETTSMNLTA